MGKYEILLLVALYLVGVASGYTLRMDTKEPITQEKWMICFETPVTQETHCGPPLYGGRFDNIDSCIVVRDWLRETIEETWGRTGDSRATRNHRCTRVIDE